MANSDELKNLKVKKLEEEGDKGIEDIEGTMKVENENHQNVGSF